MFGFGKSNIDFLIVGLGNPGKEYENTRHNIGFIVIDCLAKIIGADMAKSKFDSSMCKVTYKDKDIILLKPQTYMNLSGKAVLSASSFYKLKPKQIIVIHDDLDLKQGDIRVKIGGGNGGHNGLKSIDSIVGKEYHRIRIGIGRPEHKTMVNDYVLGKFAIDEDCNTTIKFAIQEIDKIILL